MRTEQKYFIILLLIINVCSQSVSAGTPGSMDADLLINRSLKMFQKVSDYTCILEKKVNKGGVIYYDPEIMVKYKKPSHYYFKWGRGEFQGQEVIYVEGKHDNKLVAHSGGLFRFVNLRLDPDNSEYKY